MARPEVDGRGDEEQDRDHLRRLRTTRSRGRVAHVQLACNPNSEAIPPFEFDLFVQVCSVHAPHGQNAQENPMHIRGPFPLSALRGKNRPGTVR